jgi:hypothetical protein
MENLHDKQSMLSKQQERVKIEGLRSAIENWKKQIMSSAEQLAEGISAAGLLMLTHDMISHVGYSVENGTEPRRSIGDLSDLSLNLSKVAAIIELVGYIKRDQAQLDILSGLSRPD